MIECLSVCEDIAVKYRDEAKRIGNNALYNALLKIPVSGDEAFYEALVFMKLCIFSLRIFGINHVTFGRFDQYFYSYYLSDKRAGVSDDKIFETATQLTKKGLGFPQYCNDDVVVPGLVSLGYSAEDALDYTVAACWEYIIPGCGADVPNFGVMDFPKIVSEAVEEHLTDSAVFSDLLIKVKNKIEEECICLAEQRSKARWRAAPILSIFTDECTDNLMDLRNGGEKYMNYGCHGAGIANAADALAAIKMYL